MNSIDTSSDNPFIRYRRLLDSFRRASSSGWSDADFVSLVRRLDGAVRDVDGRGFVVTPLSAHPEAAEALGLATDRLWIKDDTHNVGGSHKARHLFGVMLHQALDLDEDAGSELAIASCGNAALAAAVVARAEERPLRVFIPTWAERSVVDELERLDARIEVCERRAGEAGDPTYLRFLEAVDHGAVPFSVQSTVTPTTIDGGRTLGWEAAEQLGNLGVEGPMRVMLQIGGGAMATAVAAGMNRGVAHDWVRIDPTYHPVQTDACAPLRRAWDGLLAAADVEALGDTDRASALSSDAGALAVVMSLARNEPSRFMYPWDPVGETAATGILDDVTYDWLGVLEPTIRSGGWPVVIDESAVVEAHRIGVEVLGLDVSATGTSGMAGLLDREVMASIGPEESVIAFATGVER